MRYTIENSASNLNKYSAFNSYFDDKKLGKSFLYSVSSFLSKPVRRVFGGTDIYISSQTYDNQMSTTKKVVNVFFLVVLFPVGTLSFTCLMIKFATIPWGWEKRKVKVQSQLTWKALEQFNQAFQKGDLNSAAQSFTQNPDIGKRKEEYDNFFKVINFKINQYASWEDLSVLLRLLGTTGAITLINHAIKVKLSEELKNNCLLTSGDSVLNFIQNSLKFKDISTLEACFNKIFSDALQINVNGDIVLNAIKMDLADHMIKSLTQTRRSKAQNELERTMANAKEISLRYEIFNKEQQYTDYLFIFSDVASMQKMSVGVQGICQVNQLKSQTLNLIKAFPTKCGATQTQWDGIREKFLQFEESLISDKNYVQTLQTMASSMNEFIDFIWTAHSPQEIEAHTQELEINLQKQAVILNNLVNKSKIYYTLFSTVRLKKKALLIEYIAQMKTFVLNEMVQAATLRLQKTT